MSGRWQRWTPPIDQRYRASLTALLTRAQREHDPNMTAAIQQALARSLSQSSPLSPGPAAGAVSGIAGPARTPFVLPAPAASTPFAVATPTPPLLTPVGKWHWHSGPANTLTDKGAVVQGGNVVGQWRWTNKEKGELQIAWHGVRYRAPETFTLSPHGNHLNGSNPTDGTSFTEDRVEEGH